MSFPPRMTPNQVKIPIDPANWEIITDAMSNVPYAPGYGGQRASAGN